MFDRLPPLQTLRAFEVAARLLSMTLAAGELHLTHGAISRHIRTLEENLGQPLFRRMTRRIELTPAGVEFQAVVARVLGELHGEALRLRGEDQTRKLCISTSVSFASKWLEPRLQRLKLRHPEFGIHLDVTDLNVDLRSGRVDAAIRYGSGRYVNVVSERLMQETVTPVCRPRYKSRMGSLRSPADLLHCTLLHEDRMLANWDRWLNLAQVGKAKHKGGTAYSHGSMAIEAAIRGEGVALGRSTLIADDLAAGRLVAPFAHLRLKAERGYDLVYRIGDQDNPKIIALREWLTAEIFEFQKSLC